MHRAQRIERNKATATPTIIDNRQPKALPTPEIDPAVAHLPLRTVFLMEVGDMETSKVQLLVQEANKMYEGTRGGIHYVLPVRHGKLRSDIYFEAEFLSVVRKICEVKDGEIVLQDGATECHIVRQNI